ncbi:hypothetical protein LTA6_001315 [Microbacterium sp. LTA6]|uniref:hypothetical protein n=1 Tax=Microbacterium sp. LTA6 TaxID=3129771 RepID=UPI00324BB5F0
MSLSPSSLLAFVLVIFSALYALRAWKPKRFGIADRIGAIAESTGLLALFTVLHFASGWAGVPVVLWVVSVALAAAGVAGLVLRVPTLPWLHERRRLGLRIVRLAISGLFCVVVFVLGAISAWG